MQHQLTRDVKVGIIGIGAMGKGLVYQSHITPGIRCMAVCDEKIERCISVLKWLDISYAVVSSIDEMNLTIKKDLVAICQDAQLMAKCDGLDAIIEASNSIGSAGENSITALKHRKHLILMNSEIDLIFGPLLLQTAEENGVICTSCDGDQYGSMKHLIRDLRQWGFELVMTGNIKGFLDRSSNPATIIPEADKRNLDHRMCVSYTDGTKLNIEMAIIANAYGLSAPVPGMYGPRAQHVQDVLQCFDFNGILNNKGPFVDYILGSEPGGGVFAVGYCDNPYQQGMLAYYKMGSGPYYLFYRPYHLCHIEAMDTVLKAVKEGQALLQPKYGFKTNVYAYAKKDLNPGERLDGIGGYTCYGQIENCDENISQQGLPICLADGVALKRGIAIHEKINLDDISFDAGRIDFELFLQALECSNKRQALSRHD